MNKRPLDFLGREIKVGDFVVYPGRRGSDMWLVKSHVISVEKRTYDLCREGWALKVQHPSGAIRMMTNIDRVVVVTSLVEN